MPHLQGCTIIQPHVSRATVDHTSTSALVACEGGTLTGAHAIVPVGASGCHGCRKEGALLGLCRFVVCGSKAFGLTPGSALHWFADIQSFVECHAALPAA